jgi:uncharacterized membrane protein YfcA
LEALLAKKGDLTLRAQVGGGGLFSPVLLFLGEFETRDAVFLSNSLIGGSALANFVQMSQKRHPLVNRPLIDYDMALMIQPMAIVGTATGT